MNSFRGGVFCLLFTFFLVCCGDTEPTDKGNANGANTDAKSDANNGGDSGGKETDQKPGTKTPAKNTGKASPDAVLDAMIAAAAAGDETAFLEVQTDDSDVAKDFERMVNLLKGSGPREDGVKQVMATMASGLRFGEADKRFPARIDGDSASIIVVFPNKLFPDKLQFARYHFTRSGDLWYYTKKTLGKYAELDADQYPYTKP